jgi:hypothetical protein
MHLGLWALYVVNSTMGRKSSVLDYATDIAVEVLGRESVLWWEGSPQGITQRLQQRDGKTNIFARDEYSGLLQQMNRGGHMAGLAQLFIRAYDGRTIENIRTRKRNKASGQTEADEDRVEDPYLVKLCASTWDAFIERATIDNILDGFLARFIFITGKSTPRRQNRATPALLAERDALIQHGREYHQRAVAADLLDIDDQTLDAAFALEQEYIALAEKHARPDAAAPALKRLADSVLKVAGLLAIDQSVFGEAVPIRVHHFQQARCMGDRWIRATLDVIDALGRNHFQKNCSAVLATIRSKSQTPIREVYRAHRSLESKELEGILAHLQTQEEIEVHQDDKNPKGGRPARWAVYIGRR